MRSRITAVWFWPIEITVMPYRVMLIFVFSCWSMDLCADAPSLGPVIDGYGPTYPIEYRDIALPEDFTYKVVFDAANYSDDVAALNAKLVSVARFLNMHSRNGVPRKNMSLAVVLHGAALKSVLNNDAYRDRYDISNPNLELVMKLHRAGVEFFVCGQSMAFGSVDKNELASPARVALSPMVPADVVLPNQECPQWLVPNGVIRGMPRLPLADPQKQRARSPLQTRDHSVRHKGAHRG